MAARKSRASEKRSAEILRPNGRKRLLLVDDHPMTRAGLAQLINKQPDMEVCGEASNVAEALQAISQNKPDMILSDITMPGRNGIEFIKDVVVLHADLPVLVVSMHDELVYAERALRAGARGYIMKEAGGEKLLTAIRRVLSGEAYVSERMSARLLDAITGHRPKNSGSPIEKLSDREFEIFQLIGEGKGTREIAEHLHLSVKTVETHRGHIKEKLDLGSATALIRHAVRWVETQSTDESD